MKSRKKNGGRVMPLVDAAYQKNLAALYDKMAKEPMAAEDFAAEFAKITNAQIKTADVMPGIPVATAGSAAAQTGATTGAGKLL